MATTSIPFLHSIHLALLINFPSASCIMRRSDSNIASSTPRGSQSALNRMLAKGRRSAIEFDRRSASLAAPSLEDPCSLDSSALNHTTESLLTQARRDNLKLTQELELLEEQIKEAETLQEQQEKMQRDLDELRLTLVAAEQVKSVQEAIRKEKVCVAILECETDALKTELLRHDQKKKNKLFGRG